MRIAIALGVGAMLAWHGGALAIDARVAQAQANYRAVMNGTRQIGELSLQELNDIAELDRKIRNEKADTRAPSQRCVDKEIEREGGQVSDLHRRIIDMKCREAGD